MAKRILEFFKSKIFAGVAALIVVAAFAFQNCAKVNFNSDVAGPAVGVTGSSINMMITGGNLPSTGVTSFTAVPEQNYLFNITGDTASVTAGLNNAASSMVKVTGQCSGNSMYQPFTMDLTQAGPFFQFGTNTFDYTLKMADQIGGCVWRACVVDNNSDVACVMMTAQANSSVTTTTTPATPTTVKITSTTLSPTPTTVSPTPTTMKVTPTTLSPPPTTQPAPTPTTQPPPPPTPTTLPTAWNCYDGFGVCGSGIAIVDDGSVSPNNPGSAFTSLTANPSNGAPTQRCECTVGKKTMVSCDAQTSTGYYVCAGGSTSLPACPWPHQSDPGPYCNYDATSRSWYCSPHGTVAAKTISCP